MPGLATAKGAPSPGPWTVERWKGKHGDAGISIKDANGLYIANMVMQPGENEYANACRIVSAVNKFLPAAEVRSSGIEHVCGLQGFGRGIGSENDRCPACEELHAK